MVDAMRWMAIVLFAVLGLQGASVAQDNPVFRMVLALDSIFQFRYEPEGGLG